MMMLITMGVKGLEPLSGGETGEGCGCARGCQTGRHNSETRVSSSEWIYHALHDLPKLDDGLCDRVEFNWEDGCSGC